MTDTARIAVLVSGGGTNLQALIDAEKSGIKIDRELVRSISQYVNLLGGIYILDCLTFDEIYQKIEKINKE